MKYNKKDAINIAKQFIEEVNILEKRYNMTFNSDTGDIYLSYKRKEEGDYWDSISLGWVDNDTGLKVIEEIKIKNKLREQALSKLTEEERDALGL